MRWALLSILIAINCLAEAPPKAACNASNHARFWPEEANHNPALQRKLAQSGELELCSYGTWKYKWIPVTLNVKRLPKKPARAKEEPPSPDEPPIEDNVRRR
jgi:hypothetical protein